MKVFLATATKEGTLAFKGDGHRSMFVEWLKTIAGRDVRIKEAENAVSEQMRGYYFGAVLPEVRKTCEQWKTLSPDELHEVLKKEFAFFEAWSVKNQRTERYGKPVMSNRESNENAKKFLMDISDYLAGCGKEMPDPEEYKRFIDSAPLKDVPSEQTKP